MDGKKRRNLIIGALVILAVLAGAFCWNGGLPDSSQPAASENTGTLAEQDRGEQTGSEKEDAEYGFSGNAGSKLSAEEKIEAAEKIAENTPSQAPAKSGEKSENAQAVQTTSYRRTDGFCLPFLFLTRKETALSMCCREPVGKKESIWSFKKRRRITVYILKESIISTSLTAAIYQAGGLRSSDAF